MQPSRKQFRFLLVLYLALMLLTMGLDSLFPELVPATLSDAQEQLAAAESMRSLSAIMLVALAVLGLMIASLTGLFWFRRWGRSLALGYAVLGIACSPLMGAQVSSGWAEGLSQLCTLLWGLILALAYFSPLRQAFEGVPPVPPDSVTLPEPPVEPTPEPKPEPILLPEIDPALAATSADSAGLPLTDQQAGVNDVTLPSPRPKPGSALGLNLKSGLRSALFMRVSPDQICSTWSQLLLLTVIGIAIQFVSDFQRVGLFGEFTLYGLPGILFSLPVILLAAWAIARLADKPEQTLLLAVAFSAIGVLLDVVSLLFQFGIDGRLARSLGSAWWSWRFDFLIGWIVLATGVAAIRLLEIPVRSRVFALALAAMLIGMPLTKVIRNQTLWTEPYDAATSEERASQRHVLDSEDVFYLQPKLLERELAAVKAGDPERINLYFIGAAGYADQDVFMKEVHFVSKLFKQRFGTRDHSVMLINNPKTATESPIASTSSLQLALLRVGEVMDKRKDILFLYLTSHGSKDHKFALDFGSMRFNDLDPPRLRQMLDKSGIKRRVIVISACYSGGFVDALKTEDTLVITAAAADKTSFGCSNEAEFTYFGKAFFNDALRSTDSFIEAFNLAKPAIAAREKKEQQTGSDPRMFAGPGIKAALGEFERQLGKQRNTEIARR